MNFLPEDRAALLERLAAQWRRLYPADGEALPEAEASVLREAYYQGVAEYADRIPRVPMGICPFTGEQLARCFDPGGLDGFWWHADPIVKFQEPRAPAAFQVLLGALQLSRPEPTEATEKVVPGPEVPFVVPELLELPGMQAVIARVPLGTGDVAWPVSYWSEEELDPASLHQPWCRSMNWFTNPDTGEYGWNMSNAVWDFEIVKWAEQGKVSWVDLDTDSPAIRRTDLEFLEQLEGDRRPQLYSGGRRVFLESPDGSPVEIFEPPMTPEDEEMTELPPERIAAFEEIYRKNRKE